MHNMANENMNLLIEQYEKGLCNAEETRLVEAFLEAEDKDGMEMIHSYISLQKTKTSKLDVNQLVATRTAEMEDLLRFYEEGHISDVDKIVVEDFLQDKELIKIEAYSEFITSESKLVTNITAGKVVETYERSMLLNRYENGNVTDIESTLIDQLFVESESSLESNYQSYIQSEKLKRSSLDVEKLLQKDSKEAKVVPMSPTYNWRKLAGIAAIFILFLTAAYNVNKIFGDEMVLASNVNTVEIEDPDLALEYTLAALGLTGKKLNKGTENMKLLDGLKHTEIFK